MQSYAQHVPTQVPQVAEKHISCQMLASCVKETYISKEYKAMQCNTNQSNAKQPKARQFKQIRVTPGSSTIRTSDY